jgi:Homeodomain-like domain
MKETITLNTQEQKRVMVLPRLLVGQLTAAEAAVLLSLSERQVRRLYAAYRKEGAAPQALAARPCKAAISVRVSSHEYRERRCLRTARRPSAASYFRNGSR